MTGLQADIAALWCLFRHYPRARPFKAGSTLERYLPLHAHLPCPVRLIGNLFARQRQRTELVSILSARYGRQPVKVCRQ
uniref:Uncharacterized protein n=1 Tax=Pseudomonas putida (strain ATCC 700007 / DSM 6899 / JCM 31910 / BCRC 17059 / LMG 24140 / F1) TaxID=351746 RepID=A5W0H5_PSEP1